LISFAAAVVAIAVYWGLKAHDDTSHKLEAMR
jgi:hypothetical protein